MKGLLGSAPDCPSFSDLGGAIRPIQTPDGAFNPSINYHPKDGFAAVVRSANYTINPNTGVYEVSIGDPAVMNSSYFSFLGSDLEPAGWSEISYVGGPELYRGPEDARLLIRSGNWYLLVVLLEKTIPKARMALYKLDPDSSTAFFIQLFDEVADEAKPEKNWIFKSNSFEGDTTHLRDLGMNLRGGTPAIAFEDNFLSIAHTTYYSKEKWYNPNTFGIMQVLKRSYTHTFVLHDKDLNVLKTSREFRFKKEPIEFAAGAAALDGMLHISFGQNDSNSWLASINIDTINKLLTGEK
jgi:hypothetical protein